MSITVILTTYNQPEWLRLVLLGYACQDYKEFNLVVADDGSGNETREVISWGRETLKLPLEHVWQRDDGFRKCRIMNKAILAAGGDYLIFSDGDCIPRSDFVGTHIRLRTPGRFLSGGYVKLPEIASRSIAEEHVRSGECCDRQWLIGKGFSKKEDITKLASRGLMSRILNKISRTAADWHGHNASCWKSDALRVKGFDERMGWGGEDLEFGYRLVNAGIPAIRIRYSAICVHLFHGRPWMDFEILAHNDQLRKHTQESGLTETAHGIGLLG